MFSGTYAPLLTFFSISVLQIRKYVRILTSVSETLTKDLSRYRIKLLFKRNRGASAEVARRAGVSPVVVSNWLANRTESANVEAHVRAKAAELLEETTHAQ